METTKNYSQQQLVRNKYGIKIFKACVSCEHKVCTGYDNIRLCRINNKSHNPHYRCELWQMANLLKTIKPGNGRVKKPAYLIWLANNLEKERIRNVEDLRKEVQLLTAKWSSQNGSIYLDGK